LLDGSLDFITNAGTNFDNISDLKIDQANLGATGSVGVSVNVTTAATQAQVDVANIPAVSGTLVAATANLTLTNSAAQATGGTITIGGQTISLVASAAGDADGAEGNQAVNVTVTYGAGADASTYNASTNTLHIDTTVASATATTTDLQTAINTGTDFVASGASGAVTLTAPTGTIAGLS